MSFFQLVRSERRGSLRKLLVMSSLGGLSSAAILAAINAGAQAADEGKKAGLWLLALFVVALYLFIKSQIYVTTTITGEIEAVTHRLRVRLVLPQEPHHQLPQPVDARDPARRWRAHAVLPRRLEHLARL